MSKMKTISVLILELEQVRYEHGDLPVLVDGYEMDLDAACSPRVVETVDQGAEYREENWWAGRYDGEPDISDAEGPRFKAVVIPR